MENRDFIYATTDARPLHAISILSVGGFRSSDWELLVFGDYDNADTVAVTVATISDYHSSTYHLSPCRNVLSARGAARHLVGGSTHPHATICTPVDGQGNLPKRDGHAKVEADDKVLPPMADAPASYLDPCYGEVLVTWTTYMAVYCEKETKDKHIKKHSSKAMPLA